MARTKTTASTEALTFNSEVEAGRLPYAGNSPEKQYRHASVRGFYVSVSKPDAQGMVRRWYVVRYGEKNAKGETVDTKKKLGECGLLGYGKALQMATAAMERGREARATGKAVLPTLKEAFEDYIEFKSEHVAKDKRLKPRTIEDYRSRFELVPVEWHSRPIDELTAEEWGRLRTECVTVRSFEARGRKPVSESRFDVLLKGPISGLYRRQRDTLHPTLENPVPKLRQRGQLSSRVEKHDFISTEKLPAVWNFLETEMRAPQRDIARIGLFTGWRKQLMCAIPLDRIKPAKRAVEWRDTDEGGPYAEKDGSKFDYPISDILWDLVFAPRLATVKPGQKYLIESGRNPGEPFSDIRDSLCQMDDIAEVHISCHVLRKTFATLAPASGVPQRTISHLMMHKTSAAAGASSMTAGYQKRDFASMKQGANQFAEWLAAQVGAKPKAVEVEGISGDKMAQLQKLAEMPDEVLAKLLKLSEALK